MAVALSFTRLAALVVLASSTAMETELVDYSSSDATLGSTEQTEVNMMTSKDLLTREATALQQKMDLIDEALNKLQRSRGYVAPVQAHVVQPQPPVQSNLKKSVSMIQNEVSAKEDLLDNTLQTGDQVRLARPAYKEVPGTPPDTSSGGGDNPVVEDWNEFMYKYPHPVPVRNKILLAAIESIPPLGVFGMDRLYLGEPGMALLKVASFVLTFGLVGGVWSLCDAFVIASNCLLEDHHLDSFGMKAYFPGQLEVKSAGAMGILIVASWFFHIVWLSWYINKNVGPGGRFYAQWMRLTGGQEVPVDNRPAGFRGGPRQVSTKADPFLTDLENPRSHSLAVDPFMERIPPPADAVDEGFDPMPMDLATPAPELTALQKERKEKQHMYHPESSLGKMYRNSAEGY